MSYLARRFALITLALAVLSMIPAAGWSDNKPLEPHQPGWERWFKLDWEAGEWKGHPVVQGYLYNSSPKTIGEARPLAEPPDATGGILRRRGTWWPGARRRPSS